MHKKFASFLRKPLNSTENSGVAVVPAVIRTGQIEGSVNSSLVVMNGRSSVPTHALSEVCSETRFVEQVFTDQSGQQFRLSFLVALVNGELRGRLVSVQPLSSARNTQCSIVNDQFCLPIVCPKKKAETEYVPAYVPVVSPYIELYFFTSQPTRAPSFR